jgi:hypothetical protein
VPVIDVVVVDEYWYVAPCPNVSDTQKGLWKRQTKLKVASRMSAVVSSLARSQEEFSERFVPTDPPILKE